MFNKITNSPAWILGKMKGYYYIGNALSKICTNERFSMRIRNKAAKAYIKVDKQFCKETKRFLAVI